MEIIGITEKGTEKEIIKKYWKKIIPKLAKHLTFVERAQEVSRKINYRWE